uniref:Mucin like 3 n=1 Tax=Saimiri boliviensis boliviensis TaxID=39432 RepID=A0A2K6U1U0_SAIBB
MAQPVHSLCSAFGLQCCLLFLLAAWEAGATTLQEYQKTGELSTSDHVFPLTPGLVYSIPFDHIVLHSGQRPPDFPKSIEVRERKHHCNTTRHSKPTDKPIDNSKTTDHKSSADHHEAPPTSEENSGSQGKDPVIRNQRSVDSADSTTTHKESSDKKHITPAPKRKITCPKFSSSKSTVTAKSGNSGRPTASYKTATSFHNSDDSQSNQKSTSSEKITTGTPEESGKNEDYRTTVASDKILIKTTKNTQETISASEKITQSLANPTEHGERTANAKTTPSSGEPTEHGERTPLANKNKKTISTKGKNIPVSEKPTENSGNTTLATETTKAPVKSTENSEKTKTVRPSVKVTGDKSITTTSSHLNKTEVTHQVPISSFTVITSGMKLSSIIPEVPGNESYPYHNKDGSQKGIHAGQMGENNSFPAWAIVIVVLVAVILLLVFLGLIFLVSYMMRTRRTLTQNTRDNDTEDEGGPNSYPVYLMEQQTLGMGQIPSPR